MRDDLARTFRPGSPIRPTSRSEVTAGWIVVVDRDVQQVQALREILSSEGHRLLAVDATHSLADRLLHTPVDLLLVDLHGGGEYPGLEVLERVKRQQASVEVVMLTDRSSVRAAVDCVDRGAFDYLEKPFLDPHRVRTVLRKAIEHKRLRLRTRELERRLKERAPSPPEPVPEFGERQSVGVPVFVAEAVPIAEEIRLSLAAYERAALVRAMSEARGDASRAARLLGIGRSTLYRKLSRHRVTGAGENSTSPQTSSAP